MRILPYYRDWLTDEVINPRLFASLVILVMLVLLLIASILIPRLGYNITEIHPVDYNTYTCEAEGSGGYIFSIYGSGAISVKQLVDSLCDDARVSKRVDSIRGQWQHESITSLKLLQTRAFDLLAGKSSDIERSEVQGIAGYEAIAKYRTYPSYFINGTSSPPALTTQYLAGKRIGLREYAGSRSGRIVPLQALIKSGINFDLIEIKYYQSHRALRDALSSGEVDLIGTYWDDEDSKKFNPLGRLLLEEDTSPTTWYLVPSDTDTMCAVVDALKRLAKSSKPDYFRDIDFMVDCEGPPS